MRSKVGKVVLPLVAVALLVFAVFHVIWAEQVAPASPPPVEPARSPFTETVAGAGIVEPRSENIAIGSALSGVVLEVYVPVDKVGQRVKAGDPLFRVDDRQLRAQLAFQQASLAAAQAQLAKLQAQPRAEELPPSEAAVEAARANLAVQEDNVARYKELLPQGGASERDYKQSILLAQQARHQMLQADANLKLLQAGAWDKDLAIARANIAMARAQVQQTQTDLERALVRAPVAGDVLQVNVRPGEYVGTPPGQALVVLGDLHCLHVRVDIDEHDIHRFRPGSPARAALRGDPTVQFPLRFVRVEPYVIPKKSLTGDNTERVDTRVLQVIYALDATDLPVYVGQQLDVFIGGAARSPSQDRRRP
jgi:multidrug resistance efflux pump